MENAHRGFGNNLYRILPTQNAQHEKKCPSIDLSDIGHLYILPNFPLLLFQKPKKLQPSTSYPPNYIDHQCLEHVFLSLSLKMIGKNNCTYKKHPIFYYPYFALSQTECIYLLEEYPISNNHYK